MKNKSYKIKNIMKKTLLTILALTAAFVGAKAQEVHKDWYEIDEVTVYKTLDIKDYQHLYILPIKESGLVITGKPNEVAKMRKAIDEFRGLIKKQFDKHFGWLDVQIVENLPGNLDSKSLVLNLDIVSFDQGSRAARAWGGFGAGAQSTELAGTCKDGNSVNIFKFKHRRLNSAMGQLSNDYYPVIVKTERVLGNDICNIFNAMAGRKATKPVK